MGLLNNIKVFGKIMILVVIAAIGMAAIGYKGYSTIIQSKDGMAVDSIPQRSESYTAQAPQSFRLRDILAAHERIRARPGGYAGMVDQATICFTLGIPVHLVPGNRGNVKITTPEDLVTLGALMKWRGAT